MSFARSVLVRDIIGPVDFPPTDPDPMDDEFTGPSLDTSKWTWLDQGGTTATQENGVLTLTLREGVNRIRGITQPAPVGNWTMRAKLYYYNTSGVGGSGGIHLLAGEDATNEIRTVGIWGGNFRGLSYASPSSSAAAWGTTGSNWASHAYFQMAWDGTTLSAGWSLDGVAFYEATTDTPAYTPSLVGLGISNRSADHAVFPFDWFRRWA